MFLFSNYRLLLSTELVVYFLCWYGYIMDKADDDVCKKNGGKKDAKDDAVKRIFWLFSCRYGLSLIDWLIDWIIDCFIGWLIDLFDLQMLKAAVHYTVYKISEEFKERSRVAFSKETILVLAEHIFQVCHIRYAMGAIFSLWKAWLISTPHAMIQNFNGIIFNYAILVEHDPYWTGIGAICKVSGVKEDSQQCKIATLDATIDSDWLIAWLRACLICWFIYRSIDWLIDWLIDRSFPMT